MVKLQGRVYENSQEDEEETLGGNLYQQSFTRLSFDTYLDSYDRLQFREWHPKERNNIGGVRVVNFGSQAGNW